MGSATSSETHTVPEGVAQKVQELGILLCVAGDDEVGRSLQAICDKPDRLRSLRTALLKEAGPSVNQLEDPKQVAEAAQLPEELWLNSFVSKSGEKLSDEDIYKILRVVRDLAETNIARLEEDALTWCTDPSDFCGISPSQRGASNIELIEFYFNAYEQIEDLKRLNSIRRKVILVNIFEAIQKEEQDLRRDRKTKQRNMVRLNSPALHTPSYRSKGIDAIAKRAWHRKKLSLEEQDRRRKQLTRMSRYGGKWSQIRPTSLILGLGNSKFLEQQRWTPIGIEALNDYIKTLPIYALRSTLDTAMQAIARRWPQPAHGCCMRPPARPVQAQAQNSQDFSPSARSGPVPDGIQSLLDAVAREYINTSDYTNTSGIMADITKGTLMAEENREIVDPSENQSGELPSISATSQEQLRKASEREHVPFDQNQANNPLPPPADFYDCFDPGAAFL